MGFFTRLANLWNGFLSLFIEGIEAANPEIVYESAINARVAQYQKLMKAVSGIVYLRNKLQKDLETKTKELKEIQKQIPVAVQQGEEEAALVLIERKNALTAEIEQLDIDLKKTSRDAEEAKSNLVSFEGEIKKLKSEKETMIARRENASAKRKIQDALSGLSVDADIKALDNVRESIHKLEAEVDVAREVADGGLGTKLKKIKEATVSSTAKAELEEIRRQMSAQANTEKTL
jgi:phage shock protein A